jgi:hypothetical protein
LLVHHLHGRSSFNPLLCFVGEYLRPSQGLRPRGEEGRPGRRHRRPGRRQRRRFRLGEVRLRPRHVGVGGLPLLHWKVSCQRQHGGGEGKGKCDGEGGRCGDGGDRGDRSLASA